MIADQQCRRCHQLGVTATDKSLPEQQECHHKNQETGTQRVECNTQVADRDQTNETEGGDRDNQSIWNSESLNVAICSGDKESNTENQRCCFQNTLQN